MAASGNPHSVSFTPLVASVVQVTATFDAQRGLGSDWGSGAQCQLFLTQGASTTYGDSQPLGNTRGKFALTYSFTVTAGTSCTAGLFGSVSGASAATFWNIEIRVEVIKR